MKKKPLLFALLALAIVTSLTAGTLAVYTSTVNLDDVKVQVKKYAFTAAGSIKGEREAIKLAPTESMTYQFTITNTYNGTISEVPLKYAIEADFADAANKMPGLTAQLKSGDTLLATSSNGVINYDSQSDLVNKDVLDAGSEVVRTFDVVLTWGEADDSAHTKAGETVELAGGLSVDVIATQVTI